MKNLIPPSIHSLMLLILVSACPDSGEPLANPDADATTGGSLATGGAHATGGALATGGAPATGGALGSGGATTPICGGIAGLPCLQGQFCELDTGVCTMAADQAGTCVAVSEACIALYAPVCGCDGKTYGNDCERRAAKVSKRADGACPAQDAGTTKPDTGTVTPDAGKFCAGIAGIACGAGEFCEFAPGTCHIVDNAGTCEKVSEICGAIYSPVCGCDGKTYGNDCERRAAKVSKRADGACPDAGAPKPDAGKLCAGIAGIACGAGEFCEFQPDTCHIADNAGTCQAQPTVCTKEYRPVCGCDNQTYGNDCERQRAGVGLRAAGACP